MRTDWGADASEDEQGSNAPSEVDIEVAPDVVVTKFRASFVEHPSTLARTLYTVTGNVLSDDDGNPLSVWTRALQDAFDTKRAFHGHIPGRPGCGYFARTRAECRTVMEAMRTGYSDAQGAIHVYPDEKGWVSPHSHHQHTR
jgi:hypothetical protein